jgi:hypothetical protein
MPSRRRSRNKNLGNNLADVQRRLRNMERRPVRTKLQRRVVTTASIAVNAVTPDEVSFGTTVITSDPVNTIENPKDGLFVINETAGTTSVYSEEQRDYIQLPAVDTDARVVANGKNTIYYQNSAPSGGTYAVDDTWFDSDDGYKMYTWTGTAWSGFQLGNSAIAEISATKVTAGSLAANVIVTSNLSAGQINTGVLNGITVQTSPSGNRIAMTNTDELQFFNTAGARVGTIGPFDYVNSQEGLVLTSGLPNAERTANIGLQSDEFSSFAHITANGFLSPSVILTYGSNGATQRININGGGSSATDGSVDILAGQGGITIRSYTGDLAAADEISFSNDYAGSGNIGILSDRIRLYGALVVGAQTVEQGTGAPSNYTGNEASANIGAIFFKYT